MEVYEKINELLREKKMSKKEFSTKLRNLEPKLKNTGEVPSEKAVYSYLSGYIGLKIELVPFIAEVLDIPEQILFDDSSYTRIKYMKHILKNMDTSEKSFIEETFCKNSVSKERTQSQKEYSEIIDLLSYAPPAYIEKLKLSLKDFKSITDKFNR